MRPEVVFTSAAPKTGFSEGTESPIAQGVKCGDFVFVSGQGPLDPATKQVVSDDIAEQTRVTLDNVRVVVEAAGSAMELEEEEHHSRCAAVERWIHALRARCCTPGRRRPVFAVFGLHRRAADPFSGVGSGRQVGAIVRARARRR